MPNNNRRIATVTRRDAPRRYALNCAVASRVGRRGSPRRRAPRSTGFSRRDADGRRRDERRSTTNYDGREANGKTRRRRSGKRERTHEYVRVAKKTRTATRRTVRGASRRAAAAETRVTYNTYVHTRVHIRRFSRDTDRARAAASEDAGGPARRRDAIGRRELSRGNVWRKTHRCYASSGLCQLRSSRAKRHSAGT